MDIEAQNIDVVLGMADQAKQETHKALQQDLRRNRMEYTAWLANVSQSLPSALHRMTTPAKRFEDEYMVKKGQKAVSPIERGDAKSKDFEAIWGTNAGHEPELLDDDGWGGVGTSN